MLPQRKCLAPQPNLGVPLDGNVSPVRALVGEDEIVLAPLDAAVLPRRHVLADDEAAALVAPDDDRVLVSPADDFPVVMLQTQRDWREFGLGAIGLEHRDVAGLVPDELAQFDVLGLALDMIA